MLHTVTYEDIASAAEELARRRHEFLSVSADLEKEMIAVRRRHMGKLRGLATVIQSTTDRLLGLVRSAPSLFVKPKSRVVSDIQFGWRKGRGRIRFDDEAKVIARIRKLRPDLAETAIVTKEAIDKDVIDGLDAGELKKLGIEVVDAGNAPFVKAKSDELDALIAMALGEEG